MSRNNFLTSVAVVIPAVLGLAACASTAKQAQSVQNVDGLLTRIESVQVDATVAKEKAHAALAELTTLVAPGFTGDPEKAFVSLQEAIDASKSQTLQLRRSIGPMVESAESVFHRWTSDLEAFGNTRMRQRSQGRLDETRGRYQAVLTSAQSALITLEAFDADMGDQVLFLGNDLNAAAIASIAPDVRALQEQVRELDGRVEVCSNAARAYVESAALYGQVEVVTTEEHAPTAQPEKPTKTTFAKPRTSTLKPRPASPAPEANVTTPAPVEVPAPGATPNETPVPTPAPDVTPVTGPGQAPH